jgi:hypothetical protein
MESKKSKKINKINLETNLNQNRSVHIVYNAREHDRITEPIFKHQPSKLYYFYHHGKNDDVNLEYMAKNLSLVKERLPNCEIIELSVDYVDYYDIISKLATIISEERDSEILINLGTGSKMIAVANLDAYRLWDVKLIYPYSLDYDPTKDSTHSGKIENAEIPKFEFRQPSIKLIKALQLIYWMMTHDKYSRELTRIRQQDLQEMLFESLKLEKVKENSNVRKRDSSQKMRVSRGYLRPLENDWQLIETNKSGRAVFISFTPKGLKMVKVLMNYDYGLKYPPVPKELKTP